MKKSIKYQAVMMLLAFMIFSCAGSTETQEDMPTDTEALGETETETLAEAGTDEVAYENMFNNVENTEEYDILALAGMEDDLSTFVQLVELSGLDASIEFAGPVTVFMPTNEAFEAMPQEQYEKLTDPNNRVMLSRIIRAHILPKKYYLREFKEDQMIETAEGEEIPVETAGAETPLETPENVVIGGARVLKADVEGTNGIIHVVDGVIIPEEAGDSTIGIEGY